MGEADRIARARARQRQGNEDRVRAEVDRDLQAKREASYGRIEKLIPQVLSALEQRNNPDATLVEVPSLFGRRKKAAWKVTEIPGSSTENDLNTVIPYWFLSDGAFLLHGFNGNKSAPARKWEIEPGFLEAGLERLLEQYK